MRKPSARSQLENPTMLYGERFNGGKIADIIRRTGRPVGLRRHPFDPSEATVLIKEVHVIVGVRIPKEPPVDETKVRAGRAFERLYLAGARGAVGMAVKACEEVGYHYSSSDKAARRVLAELKLMGRPQFYALAKIKSGRRPRAAKRR
jgi:hypothetical protein